ncbi:MAG: GMC family oxidoreductase [Cytophagales bacterium]|nr:GMC family oxidoreductase [Cytophaga sp.]
MTRLSSPIASIKAHYDVVVIGSGYGGSITASRFSRAGQKVCILEKGKEIQPGEFPDNLIHSSKEMQVSAGTRHIGSETGLYDFHVGKGISVFKGCGLGGTSLVNANVSIEPEDRVFEDARWPKAFRENLQPFKEGIQRARSVLKPTKYPENQKGFPILPKTTAQRISSNAFGNTFVMLDINVTFEDGINEFGVHQKKCNLCGDCVTGCNHKSKNSLIMNYLPDAKNHGAEIFCEVGVSHIERKNNTWIVYFTTYHTGREKFDAAPMFVQADKVFLSAGALGSTEILLRSANHGLTFSDQLGKRFSGNGDVLGFGYNCNEKISGMGVGGDFKNAEKLPVGPCITSMIDLTHQPMLTDGMVIEEGSIPGAIISIVRPALAMAATWGGKDNEKGFTHWLMEKWIQFKTYFTNPYKGALNKSQVYLVMTHDSGTGKMELKKDKLQLEWEEVGEEKIFKKVNENLKKSAFALGGVYVNNPSWTDLMDYELVTVHPMGGCVMGDTALEGVVDHKGQVFAGKDGTALYPGLYVSDGSILPCPLGVNPLLTISAVAERNCAIIAKEAGLTIDYSMYTPVLPPDEKIKTGIAFTEKMKGFFSLNETGDYRKGFELGKAAQTPFEFILTIRSEEVDAFVDIPEHKAEMFGIVNAPALSSFPLSVTEGTFNLFVDQSSDKKNKRMSYNMCLNSVEGKKYYFAGYKSVIDEKGFDVWTDTSTLYITLSDGPDANATLLAKGILHIAMDDFAKQMTTMKAVHPSSAASGAAALLKFGKVFLGSLKDVYL